MSEQKLEEISLRFKATPEYMELQDALGGISGGEEETKITVNLSSDFVRLLGFYDYIASRTQDQASHDPIEKILSRLVDHHCHEILHWLTVEPTAFPYYRDVWNRLCDEMGAPECKIMDLEDDETDPKIPF
ncbi:MAG: hypothetical protein IPM20_06470 [Gammaproteobacteria bacterium]|nr:hypothetical protein [Gammaproteobacteria bacterium]